MTKLCINIDHVATLREARAANEPDPVHTVSVCELAGASGIVCHLREDRRHINDRDLRLLREVTKTKLDLEMAATEEMKTIAREILPELVTLVPERRLELTTEGGLDLTRSHLHLRDYIPALQEKEIEVSLFIDPVKTQIELARDLGVEYIEIHTGEYANAIREKDVEREWQRIAEAARYATSLGLKVNAGHGLNYLNVQRILEIKEIGEMSIGHSILSRAIFVGLDRAVRDMLDIFRLHA